MNIIEHTDVKRMLLAQKSYVEGALALCLFAARLIDEHQAAQDEESAILLDLITPVVKSFPSAYGPKANDLAIQVLGGAAIRVNIRWNNAIGITALIRFMKALWDSVSGSTRS